MKRNTGRIRKRKNRRTTQRTRKVPRPGAAPGVLRALFGLLAIGGAVTGVHYGWQTLQNSERLQVMTIEVTGNSRTRVTEVRAYAGVRVGDPILDVDLDRAALALRRHPWIENASVRRVLPHTITLEVHEHRPAIMVALRELYLANEKGELFKRVTPQDGLVFPVVTGIDRDVPIDEAAAVVRDAIALMGAAEIGKVGTVEELKSDEHLGWTLVTRRKPGSLRLHLGSDPVARLPVAERALARLDKLGRDPEVLWADSTESPHRVQVRLRKRPTTESSQTLIATAR